MPLTAEAYQPRKPFKDWPNNPPTLEELKADYVEMVIQNTNTLGDAADVLGITRKGLYAMRKRYGIDD